MFAEILNFLFMVFEEGFSEGFQKSLKGFSEGSMRLKQFQRVSERFPGFLIRFKKGSSISG